MNCVNANALFLQIDKVITDIDASAAAGIDSAAEAYLAQYLTVFISGIYEQSVEEIIGEYSSLWGSPELENFVYNQLDQYFRNPNYPNLIKVVKSFSSSWASSITAMDAKYRIALESIYVNKNYIAHGLPSQITYADIKGYHLEAKKIIEKIDEIFLGP